MFLISSDIRKGEGCPGCKYGRCIHLKPKKEEKNHQNKTGHLPKRLTGEEGTPRLVGVCQMLNRWERV